MEMNDEKDQQAELVLDERLTKIVYLTSHGEPANTIAPK